jgi:3-oxoacyl-[acyl-carrier-protein] synthase III
MRYSDVYVAGVAGWLPPPQPVSEAVRDGLYDSEEQAANNLESVTVAGVDDAPPMMAARAADLALTRSGVQPGDIALLLHASMSYQGIDFWPAASFVHRAVLGGNRSAPAIDIGQMCAGTVGGIELAASYLIAGSSRHAALVTSADWFQLPAIDRWRTDSPSIVLGDGAAALVLAKGKGFARLLAVNTVVDTSLEPMYRGDAPFRTASDALSQPVDQRLRSKAYLRDVGVSYILTRTTDGLVSAVHGALDDAGLSMADIRKFIFPNIGLGTLLNRYLEVLGLDVSSTVWEWGRTTGHIGPADHLTGLAYLIEQSEITAGDCVMLVAAGAGFTWSCAVLQCEEVPRWQPGR